MEIKDNNAFLYAQSQHLIEPDFIYFDDEEDKKINISETIDGARTIITMMIEASKGNTIALQAIMAIFAGMSLREAKKITGKSHEYIRLKIQETKEDYPELFAVLTNKHKFIIPSLIPTGKQHKWSIIDTKTKKVEKIDNLSQYCRKNKLSYSSVKKSIYYGDGKYKDKQYIRNY